MKHLKKFVLAFVLVVAMCVGMFTLTGCDPNKDGEATSIMNVSLNPEVEFVLDADGKVLTVNAINEEGNLVVSAQAFKNVKGKSAEEAVKLFAEVSKETGYIVSGKAENGENEINISISGSQAETLYNKVKTTVEEYFSSENISASIVKAREITKEQIEKIVAECAPYIQEAEIKAMEYQELLDTIVASRKETAKMYSQELKNAYYEAKAFALEQAKLQVAREQLNRLQQTIFDGLNEGYTRANRALEDARIANLVSKDSAYQKALENVRTKKVEYLKFRNEVSQMEESAVTSIVLSQLNALQSALELAESALLSAGETANSAINLVKNELNSAYNLIIDCVKNVDTNAILDKVSQKQTEALNSFCNKFESDYAQAINDAKKDWNDMETSLKAE